MAGDSADPSLPPQLAEVQVAVAKATRHTHTHIYAPIPDIV